MGVKVVSSKLLAEEMADRGLLKKKQ